jgi:hypothetical protein
MSKLELGRCGVSSLDLLNAVEKLGIVSEGAGNRAQTADVLRMIPPRVVAAAVGVGDEGDGHAAGCFLSHRLSPALDEKKNRSVTHSRGTETHALVENLEAMQPHDVFLGIDAYRVKSIESSPLD